MSRAAVGENGLPLIGIRTQQNAVQRMADYVADAMRHDRIGRGGFLPEMGETGQELRSRLQNMAESNAAEIIADLRLSDSGVTTSWSIPRQIPSGPHAGDWYIPVPGNPDGSIRERWISQIDPRSGEPVDRPAPEWAAADIVEAAPSWFIEND